jgi:hypothetical protein
MTGGKTNKERNNQNPENTNPRRALDKKGDLEKGTREGIDK